MKAVSRATWGAFWKGLKDLGMKMPLNEYSIVCDQMKKDFVEEHGIQDCGMSNGRYVVHMQDVLKANGEVSKEDLLSVNFDEIRFDHYEFNRLVEACKEAGNDVQDLEMLQRKEAVKWWNSLSYTEQDILIGKHIAMEGYYNALARAGNISSYKILEIQQAEGVTP